MNINSVCITVIVTIGGFAGFWLFLDHNRFSLEPGPNPGLAYQLDRKTGDSWIIMGNEKELIKTKSTPKEFTLKDLDESTYTKITGKAGFGDFGGGSVYGTLYNGTDLEVRNIVIRVKCIDLIIGDGKTLEKERWSREFKIDKVFPALTTEDFTVRVDDTKGSPSISWGIIKAQHLEWTDR